jgi:F-type H+-transporting ATPase subunit epsilon
MGSLHLDIVTPDRLVVSTPAEYVSAPGIEGEFGILPGHVPFLSALATGIMHYTAEGETHYAFVSGGFAEVSAGKVTILAESAELAKTIDFARAAEARKRAQDRLARHTDDINQTRAQAALFRATKRLSLQYI